MVCLAQHRPKAPVWPAPTPPTAAPK
ncbi:EspF repeat-containing protein [Limnohabitans sp.]